MVRSFIDANTFIEMGSNFDRPPHDLLIRLCRSDLMQLIVTDHTINEVVRHFSSEDEKRVDQLTKKRSVRVMQEILRVDVERRNPEEVAETLWEHYEAKMRAFLTNCNAEIAEIGTVDPAEILRAYSKGEGFFGGNVKKDQIPDAFILQCVLNHHASTPIDRVVSRDGDLRNARVFSELGIEVVRGFNGFLTSLGLAETDLDLSAWLKDNTGSIISELSKGIDDSDFEDYCSSETNVHEFVIESFDFPKPKSLILEDEAYLILGSADFDVSVYFTTPDYNNSPYDSESGEFVWVEEKQGEVLTSFNTDFVIEIERTGDGQPGDMIEASLFRWGSIDFVSEVNEWPYK